MAEEQKYYPATSLKLSRLRLSGVLPFSSDVMCFAIIAGSFAGLYFALNSSLEQLPVLARQGWTQSPTDINTITSQMREAAREAWKTIWFFVLPTLFAVWLIGSLQTKFLWSLNLVGFDLSRVFTVKSFSLRSGLNQALIAFGDALKLTCWLVVALMVLRYIIIETLPVILMSHETAIGAGYSPAKDIAAISSKLTAAGKEIVRVWLAAFFFAFFLAILARFVVVLRFRAEHRMSREELEAEYRETEPLMEMRNARKELFEQ